MNLLKKWVHLSRQTWTQVAILFGLTVLYILLSKPIFKWFGPEGSVLITIPVGLAGWYFGITAGLIAGVFNVVLITILFTAFGGHSWSMWVVTSWPGELALIGLGYISGRLQKEWTGRTRLMDELRSRERSLALINIAAQDVLNPQNPDDRYFVLITHLGNLFVADYAHFIVIDAARDKAVVTATTLPKEQEVPETLPDSDEVAGLMPALTSRSPVGVEEISSSQYMVNPEALSRIIPAARSLLCIPLVAKETSLGVIVLAFKQTRRFSSTDFTYADLAGRQIALALYSIQQEVKIQEQLKEARALANIERALSDTERVGIETVLQLIVDSAKELIPEAKEVVLHLINEEKQVLVPRAVAGVENRATMRLNMRLGEGVAGQVLMTGEVISISDAQADPRFLSQSIPVKFRSLTVAPIRSKDRSIGTISIQSMQPGVFNSDDGQLLGALGMQAAIAIDNANLLETTRQDLKEINVLYRISQGLAASLDPDQLMKDVVSFLYQNFGYYHVQIYTVDPESGNLQVRQGSGEIGAQLKQQGYFLPVGSGIVGHTAETGKPFFTNNVDDVVFFLSNSLLPGTQSELTVPIKAEKHVLGVLDIQQTPPNRLTQRDLQLMSAVADQLAVALQKAALYGELQNSLNQEKAIRSQLIQSERLAVVGRLLASVSHELNNPLQAIQNALFLLKDEEKLSEQGSQDLEIVLSETERMAIMLDQLRASYRPSLMEDIRDIPINKIIEDVHALTATQMRHSEIKFEFHPDPDLPLVPGVHDQIRQVILNLFVNAIEAMPTGGILKVETRQLRGEDRILIVVADTGPGIDPALLPRIFEPFITDKENGTGLGLAITDDIIRRHIGEILAENNTDRGATFKVWLPIKKEG